MSVTKCIIVSILVGFLIMSWLSSIMYLSDVTNPAVKWSIAVLGFLLGLAAGLIYFLYFNKRSIVVKAFKKSVDI